MTFAEKAASLVLFLLIIATIVYPALQTSQVSVEVKVEPLTEINGLELNLELSLHHYGARRHNGKIPVIKAPIKTSKEDLTPYHYVAKIPSGTYDQLIMKFSDAKAYINHDEIQLNINQKTIEKPIILEGGSHLKISLHINEELIANHTISINVEVNALSR